MFLEVWLLVLTVQILSTENLLLGSEMLVLSVSELSSCSELWIGFSSSKKPYEVPQKNLTKKYIFPSNSEQLLLKGLRKTCFWDIPWKMTILSSLRFHATIVPHLTASVGTGDR